MILFFSDTIDVASRKIIEWIKGFKEDIIIINERGKHFIEIDSIVGSDVMINVNGHLINANFISAVFYRKGGKKSKLLPLLKKKNLALASKEVSIFNYIAGNELAKNEILTYFTNTKRVFGTENIGRTNKLLALIAAKKVGLKTPETIMTRSKKELIKFHKNYHKIICKAMDLSFKHSSDKYGFMGYTNIVEEKDVERLADVFPLSLFQEYIEKEFEIRCFWFHGNFYAIAIFSQKSSKTKVDYRRYDYENPYRQVPINIPDYIKNKINLLFQYLKLNTGSLDIIVNGNDYYFLEVNPVGIFDNVSGYGNWYIERDIAKYLINNAQ